MHLSTLTAGVVVALVGTATYHGASAETIQAIEIPKEQIQAIHDNGLVVFFPKFAIATPSGAASNTTTCVDKQIRGCLTTFLNANGTWIRQVVGNKDDIQFTEPGAEGKNNTGKVEFHHNFFSRRINQVDITMMDQRTETVSIDNKFLSDKVNSLTVKRNWDKSETKMEIGAPIFT
jgi:hypothetical protein